MAMLLPPADGSEKLLGRCVHTGSASSQPIHHPKCDSPKSGTSAWVRQATVYRTHGVSAKGVCVDRESASSRKTSQWRKTNRIVEGALCFGGQLSGVGAVLGG
jgi:hypothetical protein